MSEYSPVWPYSERDSGQVEASIETLLASPEVVLTDAEKQEAYAFSRRLFEGPPAAKDETARNFREINLINTGKETDTYYLDYFRAGDDEEDEEKRVGAKALGKLGLPAGSDDASIAAGLYRAAATGTPADKSIRQNVANASRDWYIAKVAAELENNDTNSNGNTVDSVALTVQNAPEQLLDKFAAFQQFRSYYRKMSLSLAVEAAEQGEHAAPLLRAKQTLLRVHWATVNNKIAELYPSMFDLAKQIEGSPVTAERPNVWLGRIIDSAPVIRQAWMSDDNELAVFSDGFARRLDLLRNGAQATGESNFSPISSVVEDLAELVEARSRDSEQAPDAQLPAEVLKRFRETTWGPEELKALLTGVVEKWDMLSSEQSTWEEVKDRVGPASDGKWQIIVTPKTRSLSVDGTKKVMKIPAKYSGELAYEAATGALSVSAHELTHVAQCVDDEVLAEVIPLAEVKGKGAALTREFGGIYEESYMQAMFGYTRPSGLTYLRALQAKLAGGNQVQVARAFLDASNLAEPTLKDRERVADRMLRFYRSGGHSSKALNYVEQELLRLSMQNVPAERVRAMVTAGGSFSIVDMAALHRVGLVEIPSTVKRRPTEDVLEVLQQLHPELFAEAVAN